MSSSFCYLTQCTLSFSWIWNQYTYTLMFTMIPRAVLWCLWCFMVFTLTLSVVGRAYFIRKLNLASIWPNVVQDLGECGFNFTSHFIRTCYLPCRLFFLQFHGSSGFVDAHNPTLLARAAFSHCFHNGHYKQVSMARRKSCTYVFPWGFKQVKTCEVMSVTITRSFWKSHETKLFVLFRSKSLIYISQNKKSSF